VREIELGNKAYSFPWYHVAVDHHQIWTNKAWSRIDPLPGSKSVHIGDYGLLEEIEFLDNGHSRAFLPGVSLYASDDRGLKVGPGAVYIRRWYFEETLKTGAMRFKGKGHNYLFCLDRVAKKTFETINGKPGTDLATELEHVIGIIEVEHTFDWNDLPDWEMATITKDSFVRFTAARQSPKQFDLAVTKKSNGQHEIAVSDGNGVGGDQIIDRLVYALRTCQWKELKTKHKYSRWPPVVQSKLVINDGVEKAFYMNYDNGAWVMDVDGKQFKTGHPLGIFDVQGMVRAIVVKD